jgi:DnaJ-class molecular chaperone
VKTFYDELQVPESASEERIRAAYRHLAQRLHPDKNPDPEAGERFRNVGAAYAVLNDPEMRPRYDLFLKRQRAARQRELARAKREAAAAAARDVPSSAIAYAPASGFVGSPTGGVAGKVGVALLVALFGAASLVWQLL